MISRIPFGALPYGQGYLIDQFELVSNFSLKQWLSSFRKKNLNYTSHLIVNLPEDVGPADRAKTDRFTTAAAKLFLHQSRYTNKDIHNLSDKIASYGVISWFDAPDFAQVNPWESGIETRNGRLANDLLFQKRLDCALLVLPNRQLTNENEMSKRLFLRALLYSGCPQAVISGWPIPAALQLELLEQYYSRLKKQPEAQALREIIRDFKVKHPAPRDWAGLQLYGYGGLTTGEQAVFKEEIYSKTLKQALQAFAKKKWEVALNLFELAASMAKDIPGTSAADRDKIYSAIILAGINNASYAKAADYQEILVREAGADGQPPEKIYPARQKLFYLRSKARQFTKAAAVGEALVRYLLKYQNAQALAETYNNLAKMYQAKRDFPNSLTFFQKSITICRAERLDELLAQNYFERANFKTVDRDDYEGALSDFNKALEIYTKLNLPDKMIQVEQGAGRTLLKSGKFQEALNKARATAKDAEALQAENLYAASLVDQANAYWKLGDRQKARELTRLALERAGQLRADSKLELTARTLLGLILRDEGRLAEALTEQEKVVKLARQINDQAELATAFNNQGLTYQKNNQLREAFDAFKLALAIDKELNSAWGQMYDYRNLGLNSFKRGQIDEAINYQKTALGYARQLNNIPERLLILLQLGNSYARQNESEAVE